MSLLSTKATEEGIYSLQWDTPQIRSSAPEPGDVGRALPQKPRISQPLADLAASWARDPTNLLATLLKCWLPKPVSRNSLTLQGGLVAPNPMCMKKEGAGVVLASWTLQENQPHHRRMLSPRLPGTLANTEGHSKNPSPEDSSRLQVSP